MTKYKCPRCGYIYDPELGRPDKGTKQGIVFQDLPDGWKCPECGEKKHCWPPWVKIEPPQS